MWDILPVTLILMSMADVSTMEQGIITVRGTGYITIPDL